jgi:hypothetical protein
VVRSPHTGLNPLRLGAERGEDDRRERVGFPGACRRLGQLTLLFDFGRDGEAGGRTNGAEGAARPVDLDCKTATRLGRTVADRVGGLVDL